MRYWKCIRDDLGDFTDGKIYKSYNNGLGLTNDIGFVYNFWRPLGENYTARFEEVTRRDYLLQLQKEGKLEFNEQDFVNGDLAIIFSSFCEFSKKLKSICEENNIRNIYSFNSYAKYAVINKNVGLDDEEIEKLPYVKVNEIKVDKFMEFTEKKYDNFSINIHSKDGVTTCKYWLNDKLENESTVKLYYKDEFNVQTVVEEVLKKTFIKKPHELFELELENKLGRKPTAMELVNAYREEMK